LRKEAKCDEVWWAIFWVVHEKTIVLLLLPWSHVYEKIFYYCWLTSINNLIFFSGIVNWLSFWNKNKLIEDGLMLLKRKRWQLPEKRPEILGIIGFFFSIFRRFFFFYSL
jgi:hypothetical protein